MSHYEYVHRQGYGRDDHMAGEIIARAARQLGLNTGNAIAQHVGFASHAVPMGRARVRLPSAPGVRARMEKALKAARSEVKCRDCAITVVYVRTYSVAIGEYARQVRVEHRHGKVWTLFATWRERRDGDDWIAV